MAKQSKRARARTTTTERLIEAGVTGPMSAPEAEAQLAPSASEAPAAEIEASEPAPEVASEPVVAPEAQASEQGEPAPDVAPEPTPVDEPHYLATEFDTAVEASAFALNMRLRAYSIATVNGKYRIEPRKSGKASDAPAPTATPAASPLVKREKAKRAKASAPRPDTRNAVIWAQLTRPEGTTKKEVDAALAAFQPNNIQPCGIGSDAKLFSGRFGYDWKKTTDADGATRYFCFPFVLEAAPESEVEGQPEAPASETSAA